MPPVDGYTIPVLHPLVVHFPLALLLAAIVPAVLYVARGTGVWRTATLLMLVLAAAGAGASYLTGEALEEEVEGEPVVERFLERHEAAALWTVLGSVAAVLAWSAAAFAEGRRRTALGTAARAGLLALVLVAAGLVAWTAHLGGLMVWGRPAEGAPAVHEAGHSHR